MPQELNKFIDLYLDHVKVCARISCNNDPNIIIEHLNKVKTFADAIIIYGNIATLKLLESHESFESFRKKTK